MRFRSRQPSSPRRSNLQTRRLLRGLLALYQHLHTPQPINPLLQAILNTAINHVPGAQRGSLIVLYGDEGHFVATHGYDLAQLQQVHLPRSLIEAQFAGKHSAQIASCVPLNEAYLDPTTLNVMYEHGQLKQIRRTLLTKIMVRGQLYGTLALDNLRSHAPFPATAISLAQIFAEQASTLIDQALLVEELRSTNARLLEAEQLAALGRLIASVAHQLNNPLTAIFGYCELLATEPLDPEILTMVAQLSAAAEQMRLNVRTLQIFARQQQHGPSHLNLNLLIEQLVTLKQRDLTLDAIKLELQLDPDLPLTWVDGGSIAQIVLNLLSNAQHALRHQPPPRQITIHTALVSLDEQPYVRLWVADNGPGLPAEVSTRLAEPDQTAPSLRASSGLGLAICQALIRTHGGTLWSEPSPEGGARIGFMLPLRMPPSSL